MSEQAEPQFRLLTEADVDAYRLLRLRALKEHPEAYSSSYDEAAQRSVSSFAARLRPEGDPPHRFTLGVDFGGGLVGAATFEQENGIKTRHKGWITAVYVVPHLRATGLGRRLMHAVLERARELEGLEQVGLGVISSVNEPARRLYEALGFRVYGVEPRALKIGEQYYDEALMVLFLSAGA